MERRVLGLTKLELWATARKLNPLITWNEFLRMWRGEMTRRRRGLPN
jgi:hypothetical protein